MNKLEVTEFIFERKRRTGLSWSQIAEVAGLSEVFTVSACLGMNSFPLENAKKITQLLDLPEAAEAALTQYPTKTFAQIIPSDPCIYRFYEIVGVYGETLKELIQEKGGDGIMSAIDFDMSVEKIPHEKGDRIQVVMSGKFLPYSRW
ncbi:cyanase [Flexibacterium corallicola]|uniref:cyanase n=1 Tax=Flexibacterium corallicola TaxID=3037259 RepID=UPI00286EEAF4|nr:cyanase [Pseudovibrio sp. M1P-2-3]